jgi:hypothetical protein
LEKAKDVKINCRECKAPATHYAQVVWGVGTPETGTYTDYFDGYWCDGDVKNLPEVGEELPSGKGRIVLEVNLRELPS